MSSNLDQMLKDLLLKNPSLMKEAQKLLGLPTSGESPQGRTALSNNPPKKKHKAPSPDYRLIVYSGCETCHQITEIGFSMTWDEENRLFKQAPLKASKKAFVETKFQLTTTTTCASCFSKLSELEKPEIVQLLLDLQNPTEVARRTVAFKTHLRSMVTSNKGQ